MAFTSLNCTPAIGSPGTPVRIAVIGSPTASETDVLHRARYAYVRSAPAGSALLTLDAWDELQDYLNGTTSYYAGSLPLVTERKTLRLKELAGGFLEFTPDVAGSYTLEVYDVTEYRFLPHYQGHIPASGEVAELDNEEAALPAYAGGTAQAPVLTATYVVKDVRSRVFGDNVDNATLRLETYSDTVDQRADAGGVVLTPGPTLAARMAATHRDVQRVLVGFRRQTTDLAKEIVVPWAILPDGSFPVPQLVTYIIGAWNEHCALSASYAIHGAADATNTLTAPTPTNTATVCTYLEDVRTKYAAHRILTAGSVHAASDAINVVTAPTATTFQTALALLADLRSVLWAHGTKANVHSGTTGKPVDGSMREWSEPPLTEAELVTSSITLGNLYTSHIARTTVAAAHANADADNLVSSIGVDTSTVEGICALVNTLASAIERHAANLDENGVAAASAYHTTSDPTVKIPLRASDAQSLARTVEYTLVRMTDHFANTSSHGTKMLGRHGFDRWPLAARLTRAWDRAINPATPTPPSQWNNSAAILASYGWT